MSHFPHLEFHRSGIGLVPGPSAEGAPRLDSAIFIGQVPGSAQPMRSCTCAASKQQTCDHLRDLSKAVAEVGKVYARLSWDSSFAATVWYRLARLLYEGNPQAAAEVRVRRFAKGEATVVRVTAPAGDELARYLDGSATQLRFLERTGKTAPGSGAFDRATLLHRLALFQATPEERALKKQGFRTNRESWEESFWHRLAYHCVREFEAPGTGSGTFHPAIDGGTGRFTFTYRRSAEQGGEPVVRVVVPRDRVRASLKLLAGAYPEQEDLEIHPIPLQSILHVTQETEFDLDEVHVRPAIRAIQQSGEARLFSHEELAKFRYGNLIYLKELGILAELERAGQERKFRAPVSMKLKRSQVPSFLAEHGEALGEGLLVLDEPLARRRVFRDFDSVSLAAPSWSGPDDDMLARSWFWLAITYGFGNESIALADILRAKRQGLPYLETAEGWIDLHAPAFRELERMSERWTTGSGDEGDRIRLPLVELLRLQATAEKPLRVETDGDGAAVLTRLLNGVPDEPYRHPAGLTSRLRPYQEAGVRWLLFLWENRLGGLLCDDMGLGKTHQTLALMAVLAEQRGVAGPFLVVCPTSVISHWRNKIRDHAPGLRGVVHHGAQRKLAKLGAGDVLLTSYGVLRRDAGELAAIPFALAVFDEVQHVKNRATLSYRAACELNPEIRLGLTGTPIENAVEDLKTLFDLVLPGYLGSDAEFAARYGRAGMEGMGAHGAAGESVADLGELRRLISPFVLRRLKTTVLDELPEKIEDIRTCALSDAQVKLYRDAVDGRGAELARQLRAADGPLPYIHVFAVLNLLKQICDHPALAMGDLDCAGEHASGKWDLFREILEECLGSGQKVVVFTQYLGMIRLMERHLEELGVGFATLTGASGSAGQRGALVDRFNTDPRCRVFLGSLKAGGTGIDLVGGSVVIHYDRWWNAAREDQATDRVYRLGQTRAVQVFKLITEGTLEEKIAALIDRKRQLFASVIEEDDPHLAKIFSREELLELLLQPV